MSKAFTNYSPVSKALTDDFNNFEATPRSCPSTISCNRASQLLAPRDLLSTVAPGLLRHAPSPEAGENKELGSHHQALVLGPWSKGANRTAKPKTSDATAASNRSPGHHMKGLQACLPPPNKILPRMRLASMALAYLGRQSSIRQRSCPCPKYCEEGSAVHIPTRIPDSEILQHGRIWKRPPTSRDYSRKGQPGSRKWPQVQDH